MISLTIAILHSIAGSVGLGFCSVYWGFVWGVFFGNRIVKKQCFLWSRIYNTLMDSSSTNS